MLSRRSACARSKLQGLYHDGQQVTSCRLWDRARHVQRHDDVHNLQYRKQVGTHPERQEFRLLGAGLPHYCVHFRPGIRDLLKLLQHFACLLSLQASSSKAQVETGLS